MSRDPRVDATLKQRKKSNAELVLPTTVIGFLSALEGSIIAATKPESFKELRPFAVWQHLVTREQQTKIVGCLKAVLKDGQAEGSKPK
eukprot:5886041-Amphidinium_carterae.1